MIANYETQSATAQLQHEPVHRLDKTALFYALNTAKSPLTQTQKWLNL
jgi:hypothetical protein